MYGVLFHEHPPPPLPSRPVHSLHAVLLLLLEMVLINAEARDPWGLEGLFPMPLVAVTGFLGAWMVVRLFRDRWLDPLYLW